MSAAEAPSDRAPRTVTAVASGATLSLLSEAIARDPDLDLVSSADSFVDLVSKPGFPGEAVVLADTPGPAMLARAKTAIAAGSVVVVIGAVEGALAEQLFDAGVAVFEPGTPMSAVTAKLATARKPRNTRKAPPPGPEARPRLSVSERRALALYVQGYTTREVAASMQVGYETAKTFLRRVRHKYASVNRPAGRRAELIVRAEEDGLV